MNRFIKFLSYYKPYKGIFIFDLVSAFLLSIISLFFPMMIRNVTKSLESGNIEGIIGTLIFMVFLVIVYTLASFFLSHQGHMMGAKIENDMRQELFAHYQSLPLNFFDNNKVGSLMSRLTNDLYNIGEFAHHFPEDIIISGVSFVGSLILMFTISPMIALVPLIMLPFLFAYAYFFGTKMSNQYDTNREIMSEINANTEESLSGIRVIKSFANEDYEVKKFQKVGRGFLKGKHDFYLSEILFYEGLEGFVLLVPVAVLAAGGYGLFLGLIDIADLLAFFLLIGNLTGPIQKFMHSLMLFQDGRSGFKRFQDYLDIQPTILDKKDALDLDSVVGNIDIENLSFHYESGNRPVLQDINVSIQAGEFVALVGASGSGKSTLTSLITRFYDIEDGAIKLDGINIKDITQRSLRKAIGIVQQDVYLFSGSVYDNIAYGMPDTSKEAIIDAAKKANAHDFISQLSDGYNTQVGHRGVKLSGGQKQRISIARVFLKDPAILILDEATSALDSESERVIQDSMDLLSQDRTTLVIAHRLATIRHANRILVMDNGSIVEEGNHKELLDKDGVYASFYNI